MYLVKEEKLKALIVWWRIFVTTKRGEWCVTPSRCRGGTILLYLIPCCIRSGERKASCNKESPRGIRPCRCCPSPRVQNILPPPKIRALTCVAKDATSSCLAERKPEVWGKWPPKKTENKNEQQMPQSALDPAGFLLLPGSKIYYGHSRCEPI